MPLGDRVPYHLIATDMDGTLLNSSHEITPFTKSVLQQVVRQYSGDVNVTLASGRIHTDLACLLKELELPDECGYMISSNGARVHRLITQENGCRECEEIYASTLSGEDVAYLLSLINHELDNEVNINLYQGDVWRCTLDWEDQLAYFKRSGVRYELFSRAAFLTAFDRWKGGQTGGGADPFDNVSKVYFGTENIEALAVIAARVQEERPALVVTYSSKYCMEFNAPGVSKATGIEALMKYLYRLHGEGRSDASKDSCWGLADCIAFGDGDNDEEMLRHVGKGCLMENSCASLRSHLPHLEVVGRNDDEGVAHKVEEVFLKPIL